MLLWLATYLTQINHNFAVVHYLTLRAIFAALTALVLALLIGPGMIRYLTRLKVGQTVRDDGPKSHLSKAGTPTMGGLMVLIAFVVSVVLWGDLTNRYVWLVLFVTVGFGIVGAYDDYRKLVLKNSRGLPARWKYIWQSLIGLIAAIYLFSIATTPEQTALIIPFMKNMAIPLGVWFILVAYLVVVGSSNAVNLTDGLDGLATLPTVLVAAALGVFTYLTGNSLFANYLYIPFIPGVGELTIVCAALVGAGFGFLWFNTYPAQIFMGDMGSLAMGATLGIIAVIVRQELVLFIMGGIFVAETLSVVLQVGSYKLRKKRIFRMAPLHHHYELAGLAEPKVIVRFWIVTFILVLLGLASLKLR